MAARTRHRTVVIARITKGRCAGIITHNEDVYSRREEAMELNARDLEVEDCERRIAQAYADGLAIGFALAMRVSVEVVENVAAEIRGASDAHKAAA
jgi:hypothetical protein